VLTFDDGVRDAVEGALPVLRELKAKAVFFIPTAILEERRVVNVQKRHLLLAEIGAERLVEELNPLLPEVLRIRADPAFKADYLDDLLTCSMKWMLDCADHEIINPVLSQVFARYFPDEGAVFDRLYLSRGDMAILQEEGMEIGVHGHLHRQLGRLYFTDQVRELDHATALVRPVIGDRPLYMSYPSGSYNPLTTRVLTSLGYRAAVTVNKHPNDSATPRMELGRFDCVDSVIPGL